MDLIEPSIDYFDSYKTALAEFEQQGISGFWKFFGPLDHPADYLRAIQQYQHKAGVNNEIVTANVYWLVDKGEFIGHMSIRHTLNAPLERMGGHVGYAIRPSKQQEGYGSRIVELAIPKAKALGLQKLLITCDKDNIASRKIIEKSGGNYLDETDVNGKAVLRFELRI